MYGRFLFILKSNQRNNLGFFHVIALVVVAVVVIIIIIIIIVIVIDFNISASWNL